MSRYADVLVDQTSTLVQFNGGGTQYVVTTPSGVIYLVYVDTALDIVFKKSSDGGLSWTDPVVVFAGSTTALSVWYDRWSNISAGLIHCAYIESVNDDTLYRSINTESADALSTQTTIVTGTSTLAGGALSITRARGGNLYCLLCIDAGTESEWARSTDVGATWDLTPTATGSFESASADQWILVPGWAADNQDIMCFFWDASVEEISRKLWDNSGDAWSETSIATSMTDQTAANAFPHFAAAVDITNSRNLLVAWSAIDAANADLRCWHITESAITEVTNVVQNGTDDQGLCAIGIDTNTGYWWVFYGGKSDGSETFLTSINIYYKVSKDSGSTWGAETLLTNTIRNIKWLVCDPRFKGNFKVAFLNDITLDTIMFIALKPQPKTSYQIGI